MEQNSFERLLNFMAKSGDRCVIMEKGQPAFVLMKIEDYEELLMAHSGVEGLTEGELLDKINREVAIWRASQEDEVENETAEEIVAENSPQYERTENWPEVGPEEVPGEGREENERDRYYVEPL